MQVYVLQGLTVGYHYELVSVHKEFAEAIEAGQALVADEPTYWKSFLVCMQVVK